MIQSSKHSVKNYLLKKRQTVTMKNASNHQQKQIISTYKPNG